MEKLKVRIEGTRPMLMHAATGADPLNELTKEHKKLTSKRKKTDDDHEQIAKSEWRISLYYNDDIGPYIPDASLEASIIQGAKLRKLGTTFKRGFEVLDQEMKLEYEGPRSIKGMWDAGMYDARSVKVGTARLIRYRPMFKNWSFEATLLFDETVLDKGTILECISDAGEYCGIGDYRPKFGRYTVREVK